MIIQNIIFARHLPGIAINFVEEDGTTLFITENGDQLIEENT